MPSPVESSSPLQPTCSHIQCRYTGVTGSSRKRILHPPSLLADSDSTADDLNLAERAAGALKCRAAGREATPVELKAHRHFDPETAGAATRLVPAWFSSSSPSLATS